MKLRKFKRELDFVCKQKLPKACTPWAHFKNFTNLKIFKAVWNPTFTLFRLAPKTCSVLSKQITFKDKTKKNVLTL